MVAAGPTLGGHRTTQRASNNSARHFPGLADERSTKLSPNQDVQAASTSRYALEQLQGTVHFQVVGSALMASANNEGKYEHDSIHLIEGSHRLTDKLGNPETGPIFPAEAGWFCYVSPWPAASFLGEYQDTRYLGWWFRRQNVQECRWKE